MGTEQQQELKSEKPRHKPMPKNIPFTDHSIENFKPSIIARKIRVGFPKGPYTNNLKIVYYKSTKKKFWLLVYSIKGKEKTLSLGLFIPEIRGVDVMAEEMLNFIKLHKNKKKTRWLTDPKITDQETTKKEKEKSEEPIVNGVIENLCIVGFPKVKIKDETLSAVSIRTHINFLIGSNKRTKHLSYAEDSQGNGKIFFKPGGPHNTLYYTCINNTGRLAFIFWFPTEFTNRQSPRILPTGRLLKFLLLFPRYSGKE